jgi:uncharacterized protein YggU (UPF0235/DUF167 family)
MIARMADGEIRVRLTARAHSDEIAGERDGVLLARVTAPPHEGRANDALRRLIAARARIGVSRVEIVRGARAREKTVRVQGLSAGELRAVLRDTRGEPGPAAGPPT